MNLRVGEICESYTKDEFFSACQNTDRIGLTIPLEMVGYAGSHIDVAHDYLTVSFFAEKIASLSNACKGKLVTRDKYYLDFQMEFEPVDRKKVSELLYNISIYYADYDRLDEEEKLNYVEEFDTFQSEYTNMSFEFPELANDYWANHIGSYAEIASEYYDSEQEFYSKTFRKFPEHKYFFWKSAKSKTDNSIIYFSIYNWIVPDGIEIQKALRLYSGFKTDIVFQKADIVPFKDSFVITTSSDAVWLDNIRDFKNSVLCVTRALNKSRQKTLTANVTEIIQPSLFEDIPNKSIKKRPRSKHRNFIFDVTELKSFEFSLSEFGEILVAKKDGFSHVFFNMTSLRFEDLKELLESLNPVYANVQNLVGQSCLGSCDWTQLNDDSFEELCYDILYCHPKFDSNTIQKMGKSRSRDGGRDITIKTKRTATSEPVLYIFQCKYLAQSASLSASKLPNAGNVIMQYGAKGYGVFTSTVIDSTLYDMLDGFDRNQNIDTSIRWSKYELERYLNRIKSLKNKYFSS